MAINTAGLDGWPSPELLNAGAQAISGAGPKLENAVASVSAQWNGLQGLYQAPEVETVLGVFSNITPHGEFVRAASEQAAKALQDFAAGIEGLQAARTAVLAEIGAHNTFVNSAACTKEDAAAAAYNAGILQAQVDFLAAQILALEDECVSALDAATGEGNPFVGFATSFPGALTSAVVDEALGAVKSHPLGHPGQRTYFDLRPERNERMYNNWTAYRNFVDTHQGRFVPDVPLSEASGWAKAAKVAGPVGTLVGGGFTYNAQYQDEYNRLLAEHPDMSEDERTALAHEKAAFRTGTSMAAGWGAGAMGAAIGSFGGPLGTVVGFGVGVFVGWLADHKWDALGGRSATEFVGDGLQAGWDYLRGPGLDYAQESLQAAGDFLQEKGGEFKDFAQEKGGEFKDFAEEKGEEFKDFAEEKGEEFKDFAEEKGEDLQDFAKDAADEANKRIDSAKKAAEEAVDKAREKVGSVAKLFGG